MTHKNNHSFLSHEKHVCNSFRQGDWIIYNCPQCDYELRENWRTGKLTVRNPKLNIRHTGSYFPDEYEDVFVNRN